MKLTLFRPPLVNAGPTARSEEVEALRARVSREARAAADLAFSITKEIVPVMPVGSRPTQHIG